MKDEDKEGDSPKTGDIGIPLVLIALTDRRHSIGIQGEILMVFMGRLFNRCRRIMRDCCLNVLTSVSVPSGLMTIFI
ncbi:MAG TPA: hypothetical protein GXZ29_02690 [Clostridiales bacterium]|jgi:hypothetical protein|nr:hypothetical protein [Clostridiales bacterium]